MISGLRIKQQNCRKSKSVALSLISTANPNLWDIILIQEPYIYPGSKLTTASPAWNIIYPVSNPYDAHAPGSVILLNANTGSQRFRQIPLQSSLIMAVSFHPDDDAVPITIFNIYNPPNSNLTLDAVSSWITSLSAPPPDVGWRRAPAALCR